jgi:hypothetical protein
MADIERRRVSPEILDLQNKIKELEALVIKNMEATMKLNEATVEIVSAFQAAKGAFKVLDFISAAAKPMFWVLSVGAIFYGFVVHVKRVIFP